MEIKIKVDSDNSEKPVDLILSNEGFDNYNFVSIVVEDKEYTVSIEELRLSILPFLANMDRQKKLNN